MDIEGSGEEARAAGAGAVTLDGFDGCVIDAGVADETEVVVGRHHQHLVPVGGDAGAGLGLEWHVERVGVSSDGHRGSFKDAASAGIEQVVLFEVPLFLRREVTAEHFTRRRRKLACRLLGRFWVADS